MWRKARQVCLVQQDKYDKSELSSYRTIHHIEDDMMFSETITGQLIKLFQQTNYWPTCLLLKALFSLRVEGQENIKGLEKGPVIFASNHASYMDSLLAGAAMPRGLLVPKRFFPLKFIAAGEYCSVRTSPIPFPFSLLTVSYVRINGSIPVYKGNGSLRTTLKGAIDFLERAGKLWIYPEGMMTRDGRLQPGKRGAAFLHKETGAPIVPVAILGTYRALTWKGFLRDRKITVRIGKPIFTLENESIECGTQTIMDEIAGLIGEKADEAID